MSPGRSRPSGRSGDEVSELDKRIIEHLQRDGRRPFTQERLAGITEQVVNAAYTVIQGKGATNYAIGLAGARVAEAVLRDEHAVLPVSTVLEDYRGIGGVALSVPSVVARRGVVERLVVPMDERELALLHRSAEAIRATLRTIGY